MKHLVITILVYFITISVLAQAPKYSLHQQSDIPGIFFYGNKTTTCTDCDGFGLMDNSGNIITPAIYSSFTKLNNTTFLCKEAGIYTAKKYLLLGIDGKELLANKKEQKEFQFLGKDTLLTLYNTSKYQSLSMTLYNTHKGIILKDIKDGFIIYDKEKLVVVFDYDDYKGCVITIAGKKIIDSAQVKSCNTYGSPIDDCPFIIATQRKDFKTKLFNLRTQKYVAGNFDFSKYLNHYSEGMLAIQQNKKWGYLDSTGKVVITPQFIEAQDFKNGWAVVMKTTATALHGSEYMVYINNKGKEMPNVKAAYLNASSFEEGIALYKTATQMDKPETIFYINATGKSIFKAEDTDFFKYGSFSQGLAAVCNAEGKYGYINKEGVLVIPYQFDIPSKEKGKATYDEDEDISGYSSSALYVHDIAFSKTGTAKVSKNGVVMYIDKTGKKLY